MLLRILILVIVIGCAAISGVTVHLAREVSVIAVILKEHISEEFINVPNARKKLAILLKNNDLFDFY